MSKHGGRLLILGLLTIGMPVWSAEMAVSVEIPRLNVAEYHRPYVAVWVERPDQSVALNLAVWHDLKMKNNEGAQWLKDLRQWWRRSGRELEMPLDGVSSATRPAGRHALKFEADSAPLKTLQAGEYRLVVEAVREVGGRELLRVPFVWPPSTESKADARGEHELGAVSLLMKP